MPSYLNTHQLPSAEAAGVASNLKHTFQTASEMFVEGCHIVDSAGELLRDGLYSLSTLHGAEIFSSH